VKTPPQAWKKRKKPHLRLYKNVRTPPPMVKQKTPLNGLKKRHVCVKDTTKEWGFRKAKEIFTAREQMMKKRRRQTGFVKGRKKLPLAERRRAKRLPQKESAPKRKSIFESKRTAPAPKNSSAKKEVASSAKKSRLQRPKESRLECQKEALCAKQIRSNAAKRSKKLELRAKDCERNRAMIFMSPGWGECWCRNLDSSTKKRKH